MELNGKNLRRIFIGVAGCIVLYWLLHETARVIYVLKMITGMLSPFIVGAALAFVLNVPMRTIEHWLHKVSKPGVRRALALVLTSVAVLLVLYGIFALLIPQIVKTAESLADQLPNFFVNVQTFITNYLNEHPQLMSWVSSYTDVNSMDWGALVQEVLTLISDSFGNILEKTVSVVITLGNGIVNAVLSIVFAMYALARKEVLARQGRRLLYSLLPEKVCDEAIRILRMSNMTFSKFISGQCVEALILGVMFAITMPIFRMPYVALVSVIIAVTALVPIVGAFVGCFIGAFFILVVDPSLAFWFIVLFLILQQIEGNLIYPKVVGTSVGLPGMWVLVAFVVGGELMGVAGMLLMIPLASVCYSLVREFVCKRLKDRHVAPEKLRDHPPFTEEKRAQRKEKRQEKKQSAAEETES